MNRFFQKKNLIFLIGYCSLVIGFFLNENSSGGAYQDFKHHIKVVKEFNIYFKESFYNYSKFKTDHSPIYIIFLSYLSKITSSFDQMRFIYLTIFSSLPFLFFLCLKNNFPKIKDFTLILLSSVIFLSPNFRSLLIWPGSEIVSIYFFLISIYFYQLFKKKKKINYVFLNILFLSLSAYMRPIYSIFSLFFFWQFLNHFKFSKYIFYIILVNIILSIPAFYYIFYIDHFIFLSISNENFNFSNKLFIISSILCFHFMPFYFYFFKNNIIKIKYFVITFSILTLFISSIYFNFNVYDVGNGGGFFLKISNLFFKNNLLFFFSSFFFILFFLSIKKACLFENLILFILLFFLIPHSYYYHEYYEPLFLFLIFTLFVIDIDNRYFNDKKNLIFLYTFYIIFYLLSVIKNLNILYNNIIY